jgi:hypothetical protein
VNAQEFYWQEAHYDHDSRQGRELLFLIANQEWCRATSEIVNLSRSDAVETTIKVDINLDQITHEAFRNRTGRLWLPVTVLPPQTGPASATSPGHRHLEPDPFATVTDATGDLLPMLPAADLRHYLSAAMAEIIVNMAVAHWPSPAKEVPPATRDERLLLSAAIYRLLRRSSSGDNDPREPGPASDRAAKNGQREVPAGLATARPVANEPTTRIDRAKQHLTLILGAYTRLLAARADPAGSGKRARESSQFAPELARRAVKVLQGLAESIVVVVPINYDAAPTVLTVQVPTRNLLTSRTWNWLRPWTWLIRPLGRLELDLLLPTADADRQVLVHLPDGVSFDEPGPAAGPAQTSLPRLEIAVRTPQPLEDLSASMEQVFASREHKWPSTLIQSLADLARVKAALALDTLRHYETGREKDAAPPSADDHKTGVRAEDTLTLLTSQMDHSGTIDGAALTNLEGIWNRCGFIRNPRRNPLFRRTSAERLSPRTMVARVDMIEDPSQRANPEHARVHVDVTVDDLDYFSVARASSGMSLILMLVVLCFLIGWHLANPAESPVPEVLAIVLTLFAAIQAGRIERPDRSTLYGLLSAIGNWLIAASIFPSVILAVALAFSPRGWAAALWAGACIGLQLLLLGFMWRGPLTPGGTSEVGQQRRVFNTLPLDYGHFEALRSDYWRSTTADALMLGRMAYGYVIWQRAAADIRSEAESPPLTPLLTWRDAVSPDESTSVLALLHAGTLRQAITFVVFRGKPSDEWSAGAEVREELNLDPSRLAPMESVTDTVDIFVGVYRDQILEMSAHPLVATLKAAAHRLIVMEVQLPVPAPVEGYYDRQWARVRVALRDRQDIRRLKSFLNAIYDNATAASAAGTYVVAVQTVPGSYPRVITRPAKAPASAADNAVLADGEAPAVAADEAAPADGRDPAQAEDGALVWSSDLDVVNTAACAHEDAAECRWRMLTLCVDARSNIESDIVQRLAKVRPNLQLAGLTYALLHGTALLILLAHEPLQRDRADGTRGGLLPGSPHQETAVSLEEELRRDPALAKLRVVVDKELTRDQLAPVNKYPLLRIRYRWQDRPGAFLNVLNSINRTLCDESPLINPEDWSVSYARIQVVTGRVALGRVTLRVHTATQEVAGWADRKMEEIQRKVGTLAALEAAAGLASASHLDDLNRPEDPIISIDLIRKLRPNAATEPPAGG